MDATGTKASPFRPASEVPLHSNPPLAPSQEMAYRNKCIQLKRRLNEIEANNDATRKRINSEKERVQKMRFLRSILLNQLREVMSISGKSLTPEQLNKLGIAEVVDIEEVTARPEGETLLDDSSGGSEDEEIPEPSERPTRMRRTNNNYRDSNVNNGNNDNNNSTPPATTSTSKQAPSLGVAASYAQTGLPNLAPASAYSPPAARESTITVQHGSYQAASAPMAASSPTYSPHSSAHPQQQYASETRYPQQSSPIQQQQSLYQDTPYGSSNANNTINNTNSNSNSNSRGEPTSNGLSSQQAAAAAAATTTTATTPTSSSIQYQQPTRPDLPLVQFQNHMRPQLEADHYPADQIDARIDEEWKKLSDENRALWDQRYQEQMVEYQQDMDVYNRHRRRSEYR